MNWRLFLLVSLSLCIGCIEAGAASYALVVGVSEYADPSVADLEYAASDARQLASTLETQCGFARHDISLLVETEATRDGLAAGFAWLRERVGPSDLAFIYLAGHGSTVVDREGDEADGDGMDECFLPQDTVLLDPSTYVTDDELGSWIAGLGSGAVSLFLDACYSGGQSRLAGAPTRDQETGDSVARDVMTAGLGGPVRGVLAACSPSQLAYEAPILGHGVFTHYLLRGLRETGVPGTDDVLSMTELSDFVIRGVSEWGVHSNDLQTPMLDLPPGMDIPIIPNVSASRQEGPPLVTYFPFDDGIGEAAAGYATIDHGAELVPGIVGGAARFNNQPNDLRYVRTTEAYEPQEGPFAVSLWFRSDRVGANPGAMFSSHARYNDYGPEYSAWINADGSLMFRTDDMRGVNHRQDLNTTVYRWDDGLWHHLVVQRLSDGRKEIWVDGRLEASELYSIQDLRTAGNPLTVGGSAYAGWSYVRSFTGDVDELRIYSGALEANRISNLLSMGIPDDVVDVPDPTLAGALRSALGWESEAPLTRHALLSVRALEIEASGDLDLTGLEACRNLRALRITGAGISDLSFARRFPGLVDLALPANHIESLDSLGGLASVELLDLSTNDITDLTALAALPYLYNVDLSGNDAVDLSPLAGLVKMKELRLRGNAISDLSPLGRMTKLWYLDLGGNRVTNLLPLVGLPKLTVLLLDANGISDTSMLGRMAGLEEIGLAWNQIVDVTPLAGLEWLGDYTMYAPGERTAITLDLSGNAIDDPTPLLAFVGLGPGDSISLAWNPLRSIPSQDLEALVALLAGRGITVRQD
jgi:Leucine-rich repeat (LRR) protein